MRFSVGLLLSLAVTGVVFAQNSNPSAGPPTKVADLVPDPTWIPKAGDQAFLYTADGSGSYAAKDMFAYLALIKALKAKDQVGADELIAKKRVAIVPRLTRLLVIERNTNPYSTGEINALEVRFQDGPYKDQAAWVLESEAEKLITVDQLAAIKRGQETEAEQLTPLAERESPRRRAEMPPKRKPKTFKEGTPASRASNAYRAARKLEMDGKLKDAIEAYEELSGSIFPEGRMAKARLKVLTGK